MYLHDLIPTGRIRFIELSPSQYRLMRESLFFFMAFWHIIGTLWHEIGTVLPFSRKSWCVTLSMLKIISGTETA